MNLIDLVASAEVKFVDAEVIYENSTEIDGVSHINLFPLTMLQEMIEAYANQPGSGLSDLEIAAKILDYHDKDA